MKVTVATEEGKSSQIEVSGDTAVSTIKSLVASELSVGPGSHVTFNGRPLGDTTTLAGAGVGDQDLLLVTMGGGGAFGVASGAASAAPSGPTLANTPTDPGEMLEFFKKNPQLLRQLHHVDGELAEAVETGEVGKVRTCLMMQQMRGHKAKWTRETERAALFAHPDSEENQAKIQKMIEQEAIDQNYLMAMEEAPEVFARVSMLYIDTEINGAHVKAFVDSGAQSTIMSATCAERCGLMRLVDTRYEGMARGVGTGKILGRIHMAQIKIGDHHFPCSFTILETSDVEFLFGLDMLKRHLCVIDLKGGVLALGSAGATVPFLSEKDLPTSARETQAEDLENKKPSAGGEAASGSVAPAAATTSAMDAEAPSVAAPPANILASIAGAAATPAPPAVAPPAAVTAAAATAAAAGGGVDEAKIAQLVGMGFSTEQAAGALSSTGGDAEQAAALLLAQMDL